MAYTYSANRAASYPFNLLFTSLNGRALGRLESLNDAGYKRWSKTEWWTEGYERLWSSGQGTTADTPQIEGESSHTPVKCAKESVVYLTADSDETLSELKPDETYIIGGIVDRNRYKVHISSYASLDLILTPTTAEFMSGQSQGNWYPNCPVTHRRVPR